MTVFVRLLEASIDEKPLRLLDAVKSLCSSVEPPLAVFAQSVDAFSLVPGSPFAYWAPAGLLAVFKRHEPFEASGRIARITNPVADNFRFLRLWWELPSEDERQQQWSLLFKGGAFSKFYYDPHLLVRWDPHRQTYVGFVGTSHRPLEKPACADLFFLPGITWPVRTSGLSFRLMPVGCIFSSKGPAAFVDGNSSEQLLSISALLNSKAFGLLLSLQLARTELAQSYEVGLVQQNPIPETTKSEVDSLAGFARRCWWLKRRLETINESSHAFLLPLGLNETVTGFNRMSVEQELASTQHEIDEFAYHLYGIDREDRFSIGASLDAASGSMVASADDADGNASDEDDRGEDEATEAATSDMLASWLLGVAFGRFDPRLATRDRAIPADPEPFDPLPSRSPGMYPEGEEPSDRLDILVDDEGHPKDLTAHVQRWAEHIGVEVTADLRPWIAREFFPLHIKMYSKSRRKAPIYWQLATPSASYSVWLYIHAFTKDTLFRVQNDYVAGKLAHEERQLETLRAEAGPDPVTAQRKAIEAQEAFVDELRAVLDEVKRVAPLWNPDLDDGVIINFAPLWRLVPQHKPWQKELKSTWDALCAGKYDWAHLAMHLWPERVVPKCADDRSLAIAHDLEDVFWYQADDKKWKPRKEPTTPIEALVKERTSSTVKAALKSLMEAPEQSGGARRGRGRR